MKKYLYLLLVIVCLLLVGCKNNNEPNEEKEKVSISFVGVGIDDYEITIEKGSTYTLPIPERSGSIFVGWKNVNTDSIVNEDYVFEEDTFLEAVWEKKVMHLIYYKYNDHTLKDDQFYEGEGYELYTPSMEGYTFNGWYEDPDFKKELDINNVSAKMIYAYAKFTLNTYTISFKNSDKKLNVTYNTRVGTLPTITVSGCVFMGWEYEGKTFTNTTLYTYPNDITLTPILKTKTQFNVDGVNTNLTYIIGESSMYAKVAKDGYIFAGWYLDSELTQGPIYKIEDSQCANKTVYAKFVGSDDENNTYSSKLVDLVSSYYYDTFNNSLIKSSVSLNNIDSYYGCNLTWESDNPNNMRNNGAVVRSKVDKEVNLSLTVSFKNVTKEVKMSLTVKGDPYKDIVNNKIVTSYVYTGTYNTRPVDDILLDTVDIINLSFVQPNNDGTITITQDYVNKYEKYKEQALAKGVRTVMVVSGTHDDGIVLGNISTNDEARAIFVESIVNLCETYGFAGVDIDWEYPTDNGVKFTALMKDIYEGVKAYDSELLVTAAIPAGPFSFSKYSLKNSIPYMDYINIMSYDMGCEMMYHHTALYPSTMTYSGCSVNETVNNFNKLGVPLDKMIIGAAFYGRKTEVSIFTYNTSKGTASGTVKKDGANGSISYSAIKNTYLNNNANAKVYWDDTAKANYVYDSNTKMFVSYDSEKSLEEKCKYVMSKGVKGIMWWDYGSDSTGTLIQAMNSQLSTLNKK